MAYQIPVHRYAHDQLVDENDLNDFSDLINYPPFVYVQRATTFSVPNGTGYTNIPWETEIEDNDGMWTSGSPTAFTFQHSYKARVFASIRWPSLAVVTTDLRAVKTPGSIVIGSVSGYGITRSDGAGLQMVSRPYSFTTGDIVVIQARHGDTTSKSLQVAVEDGCWAAIEFVNSGAFGAV